MMKLVVIICVLFTLFFTENLALDANNYIAYIEKLSRNETFLEEYAKWSSELFSQRDYLFGDFHAKFPCTTDNSTNKNNISTSVHTLRPSDIKCIGAIGDSFTTGLGARAITPMDLLLEDRGEMIEEILHAIDIFEFRCILVDRWRLYIFENSNYTKCVTTI